MPKYPFIGGSQDGKILEATGSRAHFSVPVAPSGVAKIEAHLLCALSGEVPPPIEWRKETYEARPFRLGSARRIVFVLAGLDRDIDLGRALDIVWDAATQGGPTDD